MNIVFAISEVEGLVKTGGLADVGRALPDALRKAGHSITVFLPCYRQLTPQLRADSKRVEMQLTAGSRSYSYSVYQQTWQGLSLVLIDHPDFFDREGLYTSQYEAYPDNGERFSFFCAAILNTLKALGPAPDIIHCHDWHTAMLPFLLKHESSDFFTRTRSVFTIHNAAFQGVHAIDRIPLLQQHPHVMNQIHGGFINLLQCGIEFADAITTVSPNYAQELLTDLGSHGLHERLVKRSADLTGILNGCDYAHWSPETDPLIAKPYSADNLSDKKHSKRKLQRLCGFPQRSKVPIIGMVCRLTEQKGFGYLIPILDALMSHNIQMVIVGTGDPKVCMDLGEFDEQHPGKFKFINGFSDEYAHLIEAGADFFLMPSQFEPCGLNQMYSLAYGTIPIVRAVGGLKDTVIDQQHGAHATGFVFDAPTSDALLQCIRRALLFYHEYPEHYEAMQKQAMATRFTWDASAEQYAKVYTRLLNT